MGLALLLGAIWLGFVAIITVLFIDHWFVRSPMSHHLFGACLGYVCSKDNV
jgi:hypothetical protein